MFVGCTPVKGSGFGPPDIFPGTAVGIGNGHGVGPAVGGTKVEPVGGAGVGT